MAGNIINNIKQLFCEDKIPLNISIKQPNCETIAAMLEAKMNAKDSSVKSYTDLDELFADLKA